jgi:fatty acid CoA ligase FadD9
MVRVVRGDESRSATGTRSATDGTDGRRDRRIAAWYANDQQVRDAIPREEITAAIRQPGTTIARIVATVMEGYADRPALGERAKELITDPATGRTSLRLLPSFDLITYGELWTRVGAVAAEWHHDARYPVGAGEFVCILGFTGTDYTTIDLACVRLGAVCVPLPSSCSAGQLGPILAETAPRVLASSVEALGTAVECALQCSSLRRLVVFDYHPEVDEQREEVEAARRRLVESGSPIVLDALAAVLERGQALSPAPLFETCSDNDLLAMLLYTYSSAGTPTGAMYTRRMLGGLWQGVVPRAGELPVIGINYLPMNHLMGRGVLFGALASGGTCFFTARSDMSTLFEDIAFVRPTELAMSPRICDMLFQRYQSEVDRRAGEVGDRAALEADVRAQLRDKVLGGRVLWALSGSAPLSAGLAAFVESCVGVPLHDVYVSTETGAVLADRKVIRPRVRDYKLVDVPELGYFATDTPYPRGELRVKTRTIIPGYYKRPEVTAEVFDEGGYYRTGDIMAEIGPDELVYVDRRKNVLELSQGEFVAVSGLEGVFATSPLVRHIFIYTSSERAYLLSDRERRGVELV